MGGNLKHTYYISFKRQENENLSKQWHEGEKSNHLVGYCFCTYVTRVGGACACGVYPYSSGVVFHDLLCLSVWPHLVYVFTAQCTNTYIHTDTTSVQHVNVGLAQARLNYTVVSIARAVIAEIW